ncbi:ATP-binding protein [Paenarthrobacter sp. NPDC089316]|uniref:sensor histidine kinase n=1 Tax=unclassified Paenarthrobacter TaxID=2634190 RepID=UPI0034175032
MTVLTPAPIGVSAKATHRLMGRGISAFALLLLLQASGSIVRQSLWASPWWNAVFLWGFLAVVVVFTAASVRGRGLTASSGVLASLVFCGLALWPVAVPTTVPPDIGTPWLWAMINVGAAWSAFAFGSVIGCAYTVAVGILFAVVRTLPQSSSAPLSIAIQDAAFATILGVIICLTIGILRQAATSVDVAAEAAIAKYRDAAAETALSNERLRMDGLLHDSVMTALLTAAQSGSARERQASAELAASAMDRLDVQGLDRMEAAPASLTELAARIRFTTADDTDMLVGVHCDVSSPFRLPGPVVRAVFEASTEAVMNAARHSQANSCEVRITGHRSGNIATVAVSIKDNGKGFQPELVSDRRLGIKVSIQGRMRTIGGEADINSTIGSGTDIKLSWSGGVA